MDIIENRLINKTSQDVQNETDIKVLIEWRRDLQDFIMRMKSRLLLMSEEMKNDNSAYLKSKYIRTIDAKKHCCIFLDLVNLRIREIRKNVYSIRSHGTEKRQVGKYIDYLKAFRKVVKEEYGEEVFQQLDLKAKEISGDYN